MIFSYRVHQIVPYTYVLRWPTGESYYGVRFAKGCCPEELWVTYFSSSKCVKEFVKTHGDPSIEIRKVFGSVDAARRWETKVLHRLNAIGKDNWLNKTDNIAIDPVSALIGARKPKSEHMRRSLSEARQRLHLGFPKIATEKLNAGWRSHLHGKQPNISKSMIGNTNRLGQKDSSETLNNKRIAANKRCYIFPNANLQISTRADIKLSSFNPWRAKSV